MAIQCMSQASTIETLKKDSELKEVKMGILEELFRSVNSEERSSSCQVQQETTAAVASTTMEPALKTKTNSESRLTTSKSKSKIISFCRRNRLEKNELGACSHNVRKSRVCALVIKRCQHRPE
jgi:hypothetical protein